MGRQRELILLDLLTEGQTNSLCSGEPLRLASERPTLGRSWEFSSREVPTGWKSCPGGCFFFFYKSQNCFSSHNFDKSELFSWHKFKSSRIHGCFHSPRANDVVLESLWQSSATIRNYENEEDIFRDTVFLMFSLVLQQFSLERCSQHKLPSLDSVGGLTIGPQEYWANIKRSM